MPRVAPNSATTSRDGVAMPAETNGDPTNDHVIANDGRTILVVRNSNGSATARTLTIHLKGAVDGQGIEPREHSIAAGATQVFGPYPVGAYGSEMEVDVEHAELKLYTLRLG